jgi:hypothetical protein
MKIVDSNKKKGSSLTAPSLALLIVFSVITPLCTAEILFEEDFNGQPNYTSSDELTLQGWSFRRHGEDLWNSTTGYPTKHDAFEVLDSNSQKARGGNGKSFVAWRESYDAGWQNWNSDGILAKYFPGGYEELYVKFWIKFSPEFTPAGSSKLFRIASWDEGEGGVFGYGNDRFNGPVVFWDFSHSNDYGLRNFIALRGHPQKTNYYMSNPVLTDLPRQVIAGDLSLNFDNNIRDLDGNGSEENVVDKLLNLKTGNPISGVVTIDEVYGEKWTKVEFYVQMNTKPGALDGTVMQWINDQLVFKNTKTPWQGFDSGGERKFNVVAFGGNDRFLAYPNEMRHEEWYSIDDIVISNGKRPSPVSIVRPNPPSNILID